MAINTTTPASATASTVISAGEPQAQAKSVKKRASRKATPASARPVVKTAAPKRSSEILFKDLPNPYQPAQPPFIWIDYPEEQEHLLGPVYVVRLGIGGAERAEISMDDGPWQSCRLTAGYWWFDWSGIAPGKHTMVARMTTADGRVFRTPRRTCNYRS